MTDQDREWVALIEQIADWRTDELEVHLDERVISRVLLSGGVSRNGHRYAESALRDAAALYERKPVFLDHAANATKPFDRSTRDLAGWIAEARFADGRIQGDIRVLDTEAGRTLLALMSSQTPAVGMSHVILARKSPDGALVERIHDVISVDAVVFPATTAGFREGCEPAGEVESSEEEFEARLGELQCELERVISERDSWQARCAQLSADALEQSIDRQLTAADLPDFAVTDSLRDRLRSAPDAATRSRLIAEHRDFIVRCRQRAPCSRPRIAAANRDDSTLKLIVQAIKGGKR